MRADKRVKCSINGCDRPHQARGWCGKHYQSWYQTGDPICRGTARGSLGKFFNDHVNYQGDDCLIWPFYRKPDGIAHTSYGIKSGPAARTMCIMAHGEPPTPKHQAAHSCGKAHEGCVNPRHLRWATRLENAADCKIHGTVLNGRKNPNCKLTEDEIIKIRALSGVLSHRKIAKMFGIGYGYVGEIIRRERWGWL